MLGPSGFFMTNSLEDSPASSDVLEIMHDSKEGFCVLYRGSKNGRFFVYKALKPEYRGNHIYEELLKKDFNIGFSLMHSNICQYFAYVSLPNIGNCIVMEWIDGCTLEHLISKGKIEKSLVRKLISEISDALDYMHRKQVIHRDLKPENILVTYNGQNVKIIDFGLSDGDSYNAFKAPAGTKVYASPELVAGEQIDGRSDIWSLGMVISEMTDSYEYVVSKCLKRDRNLRYTDVMQVKKAVHDAFKRIIVRIIVIIVALLAVSFSIFTLLDVLSSESESLPETESTQEPAVNLPEEIDMVQRAEPAQEEQARETIPVKKDVLTDDLPEERRPEESIDASDLDDLFNDALNKIL